MALLPWSGVEWRKGKKNGGKKKKEKIRIRIRIRIRRRR